MTLFSDVVYNALRVSPFIGVEMSMTRRALGRAGAPTMPPRDARISLEQALFHTIAPSATVVGGELHSGSL